MNHDDRSTSSVDRVGAPCSGPVRGARGRVLHQAVPARLRTAAWALTAVFALGAALLFVASRAGRRASPLLGAVALAFDTAVISGFALIFSYEYGSPTRWALIFVVAEAALRFGLRGGVVVPLLPAAVRSPSSSGGARTASVRRAFSWDRVTFPFGVLLLTGLIVGWLVARLATRRRRSQRRGRPRRRQLRDALGRRVDLLEAANRCARALGVLARASRRRSTPSSASCAALVPFDRIAIVLVEGDAARVIAAAGVGVDEVFPPGSAGRSQGSLSRRCLERRDGLPRATCADGATPRRSELVALGLRCRVRRAAARRRARDRDALGLRARARTRSAQEEVELVVAARPPRRDRRAEHPRLRGRAHAPSRSCGASRRCARTSSRSSRTSCAARWRR